MANYIGTSGDDSQFGSSGNDGFDYSQGGNDTLSGGGGVNEYDFGTTFASGDVVNGGSGFDTVVLEGDYAKTVFTDAMMISVEKLLLNGPHRYILTLANANVGADGLQVVIQEGATVRINATKVHDHGVSFFNQNPGGAVIHGSAQSDNFLFYAGMDRTLVVDGGGGDHDYVTSYGMAHIHFADHSFTGIEELLVNGDTRLTFADGNIDAGKTLTITDQTTADFNNLIDGHKELDGHFLVWMSSGDDTVKGGHLSDTLGGGLGADRIIGGLGQDVLYGQGDADTFVFLNAGDSRRGAADVIKDLEAADHIDLSHIDANANVDGRQHFVKVSAFTGAAGQLTVSYDAGHNQTVVLGDTDGDGKAEFELRIDGEHTGFTGLILG